MKEFYLEKVKEEEKVYELVKIGFEAKIMELSGKFSNDEEQNEKVIDEIESWLNVVKSQRSSIEYCRKWLKENGGNEND